MTKTDTLESALVAAQAEMDNATLNQQNPHFKSKFADLRAVRAATLPILNKHGLGISQQTMLDPENGFHLVTRLFHASGSAIEARYPLPANGKPQEIGSAITYARRYSWAAMCGIAADEDDDGNAAQQTTGNGRRSSYSIKQKAAKGEGDEWADFMAMLEAAKTIEAVDGVQKLLEQSTFPNWPNAYVESAKEELDKRRDALGAEDTPAANSSAATFSSKAEYIDWCAEEIERMRKEGGSIQDWWKGQANARRRYSLTQGEVDALMAKAKAAMSGQPAMTTAMEALADLAAGGER